MSDVDNLVVIVERIFDHLDAVEDFNERANNGKADIDEGKNALEKVQLINRYIELVEKQLPLLIEKQGEEFIEKYENLFSRASRVASSAQQYLQIMGRQEGDAPRSGAANNDGNFEVIE